MTTMEQIFQFILEASVHHLDELSSQLNLSGATSKGKRKQIKKKILKLASSKEFQETIFQHLAEKVGEFDNGMMFQWCYNDFYKELLAMMSYENFQTKVVKNHLSQCFKVQTEEQLTPEIILKAVISIYVLDEDFETKLTVEIDKKF